MNFGYLLAAVAAATEEMSASIREISGSAAGAARVAREAVDIAASTNRTVTKLGDSSSEIGKIVRVITGTAQQTKLLALNATSLFGAVRAQTARTSADTTARSGKYAVTLRVPEGGIYAGEDIKLEFRVVDMSVDDPVLGPAGVTRGN